MANRHLRTPKQQLHRIRELVNEHLDKSDEHAYFTPSSSEHPHAVVDFVDQVLQHERYVFHKYLELLQKVHAAMVERGDIPAPTEECAKCPTCVKRAIVKALDIDCDISVLGVDSDSDK